MVINGDGDDSVGDDHVDGEYDGLMMVIMVPGGGDIMMAMVVMVTSDDGDVMMTLPESFTFTIAINHLYIFIW